MKYQTKPWSCGTAVVRNTLRAFGIRVSETSLWATAELSQDYGTDEQGVMRALRVNGLIAIEHRFDNKNEAWEWIHETLQSGKFVILAADCWEHWVLAIGSIGPSGVAIFDSSNSKINLYENGTHIWNKKKLMTKWWNGRKSVNDETESRIYAISVGKR